ncbi:nucleotidyltransferase domain-containing protein [Gilvimarinus sp. F26214L]|uniref:nucleotidyltransferase domain-containing protein n=1 Tax=Gilvimarinus sp. DZF01 TaxID=3461371 RepID=UPI004045B453
MQQVTMSVPGGENIPANTLSFYRDVLELLNKRGLPYLVGGAWALNHYAGICRNTHDFDIFIARGDFERISQALAEAGYRTELTYPHWLGKIHLNGDAIDLVFSSGNGVAEVDQTWFDHSEAAELFELPTRICPVEETIWSKAYIMERERYDGADVAHLILARAHGLDWQRLIGRFEDHWRLLLSHLVLFGFIYPAHREVVPRWVMDELLGRLQQEMCDPATDHRLCSGTLLSREQYLNDINYAGYRDARVEPHGKMTERETAQWTAAIKDKHN